MEAQRDEQVGRWVNRLAPIALPPVLFLLLRPDWFYEQNRLDTFFYTGYAQNLGYLLRVSGQMHYFVSRWPLYLPERFFFLLFGAKAGYLVFRWILASAMAACVMAIGRRSLRWQDNLALTALVLVMPMYLRTVLTGYGDCIAVALGFAAIAGVMLRPDARLMPVAVGTAAGFTFAINPLYTSIFLVLLVVWLVHTTAWMRRIEIVALVILAGLAVSAVGFLLFRYHFDIPNVYSPLLRALDEYKGLHDIQKSSQLWWVGYRIWIFLPAALLLAAVGATRWFGVVFTPMERMILQVCALQYAFQIWYQFSRHGDTLEISYYWSTMVPAFTLALCVVAGRLATAPRTAGRERPVLPVLAGAVVLFILAFRTSMPEVYSHWVDALIVLAALVYLWHRGRTRWFSFAATSLVLLVFTAQFGAPRGEPIPPGETAPTRINALYDKVYDDKASLGIDAFRDITWFRAELHRLGSDVEEQAYFWTGADGVSDLMAAMYQVQITGRWLDPKINNGPTNVGITDATRQAFVASGQARVIVLAGTAEEVETFRATVDMLRPGAVTLFEGVSPSRRAVHVRVLRLP